MEEEGGEEGGEEGWEEDGGEELAKGRGTERPTPNTGKTIMDDHKSATYMKSDHTSNQ